MTIAHLGPSALPILYPLGGAIQRRIRELACEQARRGNRVIVYSAEDRAGRQRYDGFEIRGIRCRSSKPFRSLEYMMLALDDLHQEPVDVVHFHSLVEGGVLFRRVAAKKVLSYDYFQFRRGKRTPLYWLYRWALRQFGCLLPVSEYCLRGSVAYWGIEGTPARVLYNGVNLEQFAPDPEAGLQRRRELGIGDEPVMLYVGRVCEQKGTDTLIQAYQLVRMRRPEVRLVAAGPAGQFGNAESNELVRRIRDVGGLYLGAVDEHSLPAIYNVCDVFVMPTREYEMFGMAAAEAQACGKPVVCTAHGGLPEVISESSGLFFPVGDPEALAAQVCSLLADRRRYFSMVRAARENSRRFRWSAIVDQLEQIYQEAA
ncbi:MAG: glycosyltransferase family 4 protein [Acidobacteria bacterium]|nr:glycosyltransferase family 4 protein [Acidobacteriota bacterium]